MSIAPQLRALRQHNHFIIGTPGRLKDLVERKSLHLSSLRTLVLDEADRMLDMGFVLEMKYVIERMPKERHTLLFTATLSKEIAKTAEEFLHNPEHISVKTADTSKNIEQDVIHIGREENKIDILHKLLEDASFEKVLVFGRTKHGVEQLSQMLHKRGVHSASIHGNKSHSQRVRALDDFKKNRARVLVATDVAARGLDIPLVSHVINYDVPGTYDDYVHRIGRTGRADKTGKALTFIGSGTRSTEEKESFSSFGRGFQNTGRGRSGGGIKKPSEKRNSSFRRERNTFEKKR
jgi:ATP-dependent RNA helicase RhlE